MPGTPTVVAAAAAAILTTRHLGDEARHEVGDQRYFVHSHIATLENDEPALLTYLEDIYGSDRRAPTEVGAPRGPNGDAFRRLADSTSVVSATAEIAALLQDAMESKSATPGILFGFSLLLDDDREAFGVIKADLEDDRRFFMEVGSSGTWSLGQVQDILPPPRTKYAKYAISPRPRMPGAVGIRDTQADPDSAADYFLHAVGLVVPRRKGTKRAVAHTAKRSGYADSYIRDQLAQVEVDTPLDAVIDRSFAEIPDSLRKGLRGTSERPMDTVVAQDPYFRKYFTRNPRFELIVDESVDVTIEGRTITVVLPPEADIVDNSYTR